MRAPGYSKLPPIGSSPLDGIKPYLPWAIAFGIAFMVLQTALPSEEASLPVNPTKRRPRRASK